MTVQAIKELGRIPVNSTGSMSTSFEDGAIKLYSYHTIVGYIKNGKAIIVYENIDTENDFINMEVDFFMNYDFIGNAKLSFGEKNE